MGSYTDFLYARPSLAEGIGSVVDLFGTMQQFNSSRTPEEADTKALWSDFKSVGIDLEAAAGQIMNNQ